MAQFPAIFVTSCTKVVSRSGVVFLLSVSTHQRRFRVDLDGDLWRVDLQDLSALLFEVVEPVRLPLRIAARLLQAAPKHSNIRI